MRNLCFLSVLALAVTLTFQPSTEAQRPQPTPPPRQQSTIPIYESSASGANPGNKQTRSATPPPRISQLTPLDQLRAGNFTVLSLDGNPVRLGELLDAGKPALIEFWQTSCEQSFAEITYLNDVWQRYQKRGMVMLALTIDNPAQRREVSAFVRRERMSYPVYFASPGLYKVMTGGATGTPQTYVFSRDGRIANRMFGWEPKRGKPALEASLESVF